MLRLISILLLLCGLGAAGYAGSVLLEQYAPHDEVVTTNPVEEAETEQAFEMAETEALPPITEDEVIAAEPAPAPRAARSIQAEDMENGMADSEMADSGLAEIRPQSAEILEGFDAPLAQSRSANVQPSVSKDFIENLKTVPVAHETPSTAEYKRAFDVTLAIDSTGDDSAADALPGRGNIIEGEAKVSDRVEARLSGANFEIVPMSPDVQSLSPLTENVWRWSVTPLSAGSHDLVFEIYAIDEDTVTPLRTFRDTVTVQVSGLNRAIAFADQANPLFVLLGGLGSAIAGLIGVIRFFGRK
ncbi:hypothetical protein [Hyphomonas pacifica]|uniref:hypothetical protein n=1 Tax=Hyphomonas pacifica TaxID=1280941 RepID=UPI000DC016BC|nr:hypothetical protein [Hyphomonas pacifica]MBR9806571.1 hypothetical protein [Alphaproteobacteria bacterium]RAN31846.1 hypothetical protein HY11_06580 [Hyphomonas pacifica]